VFYIPTSIEILKKNIGKVIKSPSPLSSPSEGRGIILVARGDLL